MKKSLFIVLLGLISVVGISQKVPVGIVKVHDTGISEWKILDENRIPVFCGEEFTDNDTVVVSLEAVRRYFLNINVNFINNRDTILYLVIIDEEPVLIISSDIEPGEHIFPFFTGTRNDQSKIIGGSSVSISQYPWQVYIVSGNFLCGGSIIAPGWVVTAAHCVTDNGVAYQPADIKITANTATPTSGGTKYSIKEVIVHEQYDRTTVEYDIALLKTNLNISCTNCKPIKLVNSINVEEGFTDPGSMSTITGWGLTRATSQILPFVLQMAQVPVVSNQTASIIWKAIPSTSIMAGYLDGNKDVCSGDSGGPMTVVVEGESKLAGIISWGSGDCDTYSGYTRVSALESWIRSKTGIVDFTLAIPEGDSVVCQGTATTEYTAEVVSGTPVYEWELVPSASGTISWNSNIASVSWNDDYIGDATVKARVLVNGNYSEWGRRSIIRALNTMITSQPEDIVFCEKDTLNLRTLAEGNSLFYDWYSDGVIVSSGDSDSLYLPGLVPENSGTYRVQVTGLCGSLSTNTFEVTVHPVTLVNNISPDVSTDYGSNIILEVNASGHELAYQWKQDGKFIENANSPLYEILDADAQNIGLYKSVVSGTCGIEISDPVYVYLKNEEPGEEELSVWPSLTSDEVNIAPGWDDEYSLQIISPSGKLMLNSPKCRYRTTVNIGNYPKGLYIVKITSATFSRSVKVVKE